MDQPGRRYTEKEFALILRRASELQARPTALPSGEQGLSLPEIAAVAREVGIDPALVERAALELGQPSTRGLARVLGGEARSRIEATVPGTLAEGDYQRVADAVRRATGLHGEARQELGSLEWSHRSDVSHLFVTVTPGEDTTAVVVSADRSSAQAMTWLFSGLVSLIAAGITGAVLEPSTVAGGAGIVAGMLGVGAVTARTIWSSATRRFEARMEAVLAAVRREIAGASENP